MTTTNHPIAPEEIMAYLDGELAPEQAAVTAVHLENCLECQQLAAELRGLSQQIKAWPVPTRTNSQIPAEVSAALNALETERMPMPAIPMPWSLRMRAFFKRWTPALAGCSFVALLVVISLRFIGSNSNTAFSTVASAVPQKESRKLRQSEQDKAIVGGMVAAEPTLPPGIVSLDNSGGAAHQRTDSRALASPEMEARQNGPLTSTTTEREETPNFTASGPMIIRTAALALTTKDFERARAQVEDILKRQHGYVGSLNVTANPGAGRTLTGSLRIPSHQLDATLTELKALGRLDSESQNGEDVTAQYVDLNARLANSRHTEQRLIDLLANRTGKLSDVLAVENELARVRGEIESMEAERKTMANQVDFATINLTISEDYRAQLQVVPPSTFTRLSNAAVEGYRNLSDGLISVALFCLSSGPSLLFWIAILFFPARFAWRKLRQSAA